MIPKPRHLDIQKDQGLRVEWADGTESWFPVEYLRKWSPSADQKKLREELAKNPLAVLPTSAISGGKPLTIEDAQLVGNYALKIRFSDGHDTGLYSWEYLHEIDPKSRSARPGGPTTGEGGR